MRWWAWIIDHRGAVRRLTGLRPQLLTPLNRWWLKLGLLLGHVLSPDRDGDSVHLAIMPIGLIMRLSGKAAMRAHFDREASSYWVWRDPPGPPPESLNNQF